MLATVFLKSDINVSFSFDYHYRKPMFIIFYKTFEGSKLQVLELVNFCIMFNKCDSLF